jgi:hypothetical protein
MSFALADRSKTNKSKDGKMSIPAKPSLSEYHHVNNLKRDSLDPIFHPQQAIGNQAVQRLMSSNNTAKGFDLAKISIQPKLKVSQPDDAYEQEADKVAEKIMSMTNDNPIASTLSHKEEKIDRKCATCEMKEKEKKEEKLKISRKPSNTSILEESDEISNEINNIRSDSGIPLDRSTGEFMESRFGYDFSNVRIHADEKAARSASSLNALAFTLGNDIVFAEGQYRPTTMEGRTLLGHELIHTIQQGFTSRLVYDDSRKTIHSTQILASRSKTGNNTANHSTEHIHANDSDIRLQRQADDTPRVSLRSPVFEEFVTQVSSLLPGRPLTLREEQLARSIFASSIDYSRVRLISTDILEYRTVANSIRVPKNFTVANSSMAQTLIHEMTHVWQYQHAGTSYISVSLASQITASIRGGSRNLAYDYQITSGMSFFDFLPEQQGLLVENYYAMLRDKTAQAGGTYRSNHLDASGNFRLLSWADRQAEITRELPLHEPLIRQMQAALPRPEAEIVMQRASEVMRIPGEGILTRPTELPPLDIKPVFEIRF